MDQVTSRIIDPDQVSAIIRMLQNDNINQYGLVVTPGLLAAYWDIDIEIFQ